MKKWLYHDNKDPKLVDLPDQPGPQSHKLAELYEDGWRDSPADLPAKPGYRGSIPIPVRDEQPEADEVAQAPRVMRAKLRVTGVLPFDGGESVTFAAVVADHYSEDGSDEDNTFAKFTPAADLTMTIQNPDLVGALPVDSVYYVDFIRAKVVPPMITEETPVIGTESTTENEVGENAVDGGTGAAPVDDGADPVIEAEEGEEDEAAALLVQFQRDPKSLNKDQHVQLGAALGLRLMKAWNEGTLINKINEALNDGNAEKAD